MKSKNSFKCFLVFSQITLRQKCTRICCWHGLTEECIRCRVLSFSLTYALKFLHLSKNIRFCQIWRNKIVFWQYPKSKLIQKIQCVLHLFCVKLSSILTAYHLVIIELSIFLYSVSTYSCFSHPHIFPSQILLQTEIAMNIIKRGL